MSSISSGASADLTSEAPDPKRWRALFVIAMAQLMVILDASIVNIALPRAGKTSVSPTLTGSGWSPPTRWRSGPAPARRSHRRLLGTQATFLLGLVGFAFASALGGLAPTAGLLFGARALQGVFAALLRRPRCR